MQPTISTTLCIQKNKCMASLSNVTVTHANGWQWLPQFNDWGWWSTGHWLSMFEPFALWQFNTAVVNHNVFIYRYIRYITKLHGHGDIGFYIKLSNNPIAGISRKPFPIWSMSTSRSLRSTKKLRGNWRGNSVVSCPSKCSNIIQLFPWDRNLVRWCIYYHTHTYVYRIILYKYLYLCIP